MKKPFLSPLLITVPYVFTTSLLLFLELPFVGVPGACSQTLDTGTYAVPFLNEISDARISALGGAGTADSNSPSSIFYNPANLPRESPFSATLEYDRMYQDIAQHLLAVGGAQHGFRWGTGIALFRVGGIERRDEIPTTEPLGTFSMTDAVAGIAGATTLAGFIDAGVQLKTIFEKIYTSNAFGFALDAGLSTLIRHRTFRSRVSLVAANLGPDMGFSSDTYPLPWQVGMGIELLPIHSFVAGRVVILGDVVLQNDSHRERVGIEVLPCCDIALRYGYAAGYDTRSHTFGLGYRWESLQFNYAYIPYKMDFGDVHKIGVAYTL
jgi:hypothetical protein